MVSKAKNDAEVSQGRSAVYNLRLDASTYTTLKRIADREEVPMSFIIRRALRKGLGLPMDAKEQEPLAMPDWEN